MARKRTSLYAKSDWARRVEGRKSNLEPYRSPARKDFARLIHCPAFRRLQGKTQLFPSHESDFFRNRLTHSFEVAQIAKSIAITFNNRDEYFKKNKIDLDVVEFAALAHDLGHPPFGHNGEKALDELMMDDGGFEGNAQTLRILACTEKKETTNFPLTSSVPLPFQPSPEADLRRGLNLTYRSLASILKYDRQIPQTKSERKKTKSDGEPCKGYYGLERDVASALRENVASTTPTGAFKTIECSIMDVADDIAYSTYDIEDSFKAGFLSPISMMAASDAFKSSIARYVQSKIDKEYPELPSSERSFSVNDVDGVLAELFKDTLEPDERVSKRFSEEIAIPEAAYILATTTFDVSRAIGENGYVRTSFTSLLVGRFIRAVEVVKLGTNPVTWRARMKLDTFRTVETLKSFAYQQLIESPRLKLVQKRGKEIIAKLFDSFVNDGDLLPDDWKSIYAARDDNQWRRRTVCDYIAGMTDRYCVEMYARLTGQDPMTFWKPH